MTPSLLFFVAIFVVLLVALGWFVFSKSHNTEKIPIGRHEREWTHISYLPYVKQALTEADFEFLKRRGSPALAKRVRTERQRITLFYLAALRKDFDRLLHTARVLAVMSPNIKALTELRGFQLQTQFIYLYYAIRLRLVLGIAPFEAIGHLSEMVSALTVQMETAMSQLTERAALPEELHP